jgi:hypothetical protein
MALPTIEKTWEFRPVSISYGATDGLLKAKNLLKSFPTNPWTVWGSGNRLGSVSNGTGVDYWNSTSDITYSTGTSYSWIVLQQPALGAKTAVMISYNNPNPPQSNLVLSPVNGFGAANGGVDGTTGIPPSATDGITLPYNNSGGFFSGATYIYTMMSTDGLCTRLFTFYGGTLSTLWLFERPKNPTVTITNSIIGCALTGSDLLYILEDPTYTPFRTRIASGSLDYGVPTSEGYYTGSTKLGALTYADDISAEWHMCPIGLFFTSTSHRGRKGELYDIWRCGSPKASPIPDDGTRRFMSLGGLVVPWDGASNLVYQ